MCRQICGAFAGIVLGPMSLKALRVSILAGFPQSCRIITGSSQGVLSSKHADNTICDFELHFFAT